MLARELDIRNASGLHARPASILVQAAQGFESTVRVVLDGRSADAKSILEVLTLGVERGARIRLEVEGADEGSALAALGKLVEDGLGEGA